MSASMTFDKKGLDDLIRRFEDPTIKRELEALPQKKGVAAIIAQAIADNFDKEGPGWAPLKAETIRASVSEKMKKRLSQMTNEKLLRWEKKARIPGTKEEFAGPHRMILQRTGLLKKSVTVPGAKDNIWKTDGTNLVWGTDLVYAGVHNRGNPSKGIPKREFLTIRKEWMDQLNTFIIDAAFKIIVERIMKG